MSDFEEHVVDHKLDDNEYAVQVAIAQQKENKHVPSQLDNESTTVLIAYNLKTCKELYEKQFEINHAKRILAIQNSGWKQRITIS